jgi:exonuclease III
MVNSCRTDIVCLQKTKLDFFDRAIVSNVLGPDFEVSFLFLPADGTRGGILLAAKSSCCQLQSPHLTNNDVTASVLDTRINNLWTITGVYGPQGNLEKKSFLSELKQLKSVANPQWMLLGDFNMIYRAQDKNSGRLDRRLMLRFSKTINHLEVREADLIGKRYT